MNDDPITLRRQMDETMRGQIESDRNRINLMSERISRVEVALENISQRFDDHEEAATEIQNKLIGIAEKMTGISAHFSDHVMREEQQWEIINESAKTLQEVTKALTLTEHRVSALDRMVWALGGFLLSGFGVAIAWVIQHLESLAR
jgi:DNA repair exonuclease SbcCD ATPase subunit